MGTIRIERELKTVNMEGREREVALYTRGKLKKFNPRVLGLGEIDASSSQREAIAAVFDLEGFTNFCKQVDPHLSLPNYLNNFLSWLFEAIKVQLIERRFRKGYLPYTDLPFFAKFLGDGVLFLWDVRDLNTKQMCNVVVMLENICNKYKNTFVPKNRKEFSEIPPKLRCGVARGIVCSVGNGEDYVGPCINIASRLQKISSLPFCFSKRGFDYEKGMIKKTADTYAVKRVAIRGIGDDERVCVAKVDFERLKKKEKDIFKEV